jgi:hypothetical protein
MDCIQEKNTRAEATGGSLARSAKRILSTVSENLRTFTADNFMNINISINQKSEQINMWKENICSNHQTT